MSEQAGSRPRRGGRSTPPRGATQHSTSHSLITPARATVPRSGHREPPNQMQLHAAAVQAGVARREAARRRGTGRAVRRLAFEEDGVAAPAPVPAPAQGVEADLVPAVMPPPPVPRRAARRVPSTPPRQVAASASVFDIDSLAFGNLASPGSVQGESEHSITAAGASSFRDELPLDGTPTRGGTLLNAALPLHPSRGVRRSPGRGSMVSLSPEQPDSGARASPLPTPSRRASRLLAMATDAAASQISSPDRPGDGLQSAAQRNETAKALMRQRTSLGGAFERRPSRTARARAQLAAAVGNTDTASVASAASSLVSAQDLVRGGAGGSTTPERTGPKQRRGQKLPQARLAGDLAPDFKAGETARSVGDASSVHRRELGPVQPSAVQRARALLGTAPAARPTPTLPPAALPLALKLLVACASALDTVMNMHMRRRGASTVMQFEELKPSVEGVTRKRFTLQHLQRLAGVAPDHYTLAGRCMNAAGQPLVGPAALDKRNWRVVVSWPPPKASAGLKERRHAFAAAAWDLVSTAHATFLKGVGGAHPHALTTHRRWHPEFPLEDVPIPTVPLPQPHGSRMSSAAAVLAAAPGAMSQTARRALLVAAGRASPARVGGSKRPADASAAASPPKSARVGRSSTPHTPIRGRRATSALLAAAMGQQAAKEDYAIPTGSTASRRTAVGVAGASPATTAFSPRVGLTPTGGRQAAPRDDVLAAVGSRRPTEEATSSGSSTGSGEGVSASRAQAGRLLASPPGRHPPVSSGASTATASTTVGVVSVAGGSSSDALAFLSRHAPTLMARARARSAETAAAGTTGARAAVRQTRLRKQLPVLMTAVSMQFLHARKQVLPLPNLVSRLVAAAKSSGAPTSPQVVLQGLRDLASFTNGWCSIIVSGHKEYVRLQKTGSQQELQAVKQGLLRLVV